MPLKRTDAVQSAPSGDGLLVASNAIRTWRPISPVAHGHRLSERGGVAPVELHVRGEVLPPAGAPREGAVPGPHYRRVGDSWGGKIPIRSKQ